MRKTATRFLMLALVCMFLSPHAFSQATQTVSGVVRSDSSILSGVSVIEKGTSKGTVTDAEGKFKLTVSPNATLVFSSLGYELKEVKTGNQSTLSIVLNSADASLNEVVVTALGVKREKH